MNFFSNKNNIWAIVIAISLFCIMPLTWSRNLLDMDTGLRFVTLTIVVFLISIYFLLHSKNEILPEIYSLFRSKVTIFFTGYLFFTLSALVFSINRGEALYELIKTVLFFFLFLCLIIFIRGKNKEKQIFIFFIQIAVIIFCSFGLIQIAPLFKEYFQSETPVLINYSIRSSLSNKNFFAEALMLSLPFSLYGVFCLHKSLRAIFVASTVLILFFLLLLQTISTWVGLSAATGISLLVILLNRKKTITAKLLKPISRKWMILFSLIVILFTAVALNVYMKTENAILLKERIRTAVSYMTNSALKENVMVNNNSTYERMILWRNSWKMIKEYPFGAGLNNWKIYFPKYGVTGAPFMNYGTVRFENPHNDFLFIWCEKGITGLVFYVLLLFAAIHSSIKSIRLSESKNDKWLAVFLLAGIISFICISLFGFPGQRIFSMILLMIILAMIVSLEKKQDYKAAKTNLMLSSKWIFIIATVISVSGIFIGVQRLNSEKHLVNALISQKQKNWSRMIRELNRAENKFFPMDYTSTPIAWYSGFAYFYLGNRQEAFVKFREAEKINPWHINVLNDLGTCYHLEGNVTESKNYYQKILNISPHFPDALINMAVMHYNAGKIDSAMTVISRYITKDNKEHMKTMKTIIYASASETVNSVTDEKIKTTGLEKIKDEKWLYAVFKDSKKKNNFKELLMTSLKNIN